MKKHTRVIYHKAEWIFIEKLGDKYLLKSLNKNVNDILADPVKVKLFIAGRKIHPATEGANMKTM